MQVSVLTGFRLTELVVLYRSRTPPRSPDGPTSVAPGHPRLDQRHRGSEGRPGRSLPVPRSRRHHTPDDQERPTKTAATSALHRPSRSASEATHPGPARCPRTSTFAEAAELYLVKIARKREDTTYVEYRARLDNYVLPALGALRLRECTVAQLDRYFDAERAVLREHPSQRANGGRRRHAASGDPRCGAGALTETREQLLQ